MENSNRITFAEKVNTVMFADFADVNTKNVAISSISF